MNYGFADNFDKKEVYTKSEVDALLSAIQDQISNIDMGDAVYEAVDTISIPNDTNGRIRCAGYISEAGKHLRVTVPTKPIVGTAISITNLYISVRLVTGGYGFIQCNSGDTYNVELGSYGQQLISNGAYVVDDEEIEPDYISVTPLLTNGQMTLLIKFKYALRRDQGDYAATNNAPVAFDIAGDFVVS